MCGIRTDRSIVCWGDHSQGNLHAPEGGFTHVSAGWDHTCAIRTDRTIVCWDWGSLYDQTDSPEGEFTRISAGWDHTCGIRTDHTISCWGSNTDGQTDPPEGEFIHISADDYYTCGIRTDRTITCWGWQKPLDEIYAPEGESPPWAPAIGLPGGCEPTGPSHAGKRDKSCSETRKRRQHPARSRGAQHHRHGSRHFRSMQNGCGQSHGARRRSESDVAGDHHQVTVGYRLGRCQVNSVVTS